MGTFTFKKLFSFNFGLFYKSRKVLSSFGYRCVAPEDLRMINEVQPRFTIIIYSRPLKSVNLQVLGMLWPLVAAVVLLKRLLRNAQGVLWGSDWLAMYCSGQRFLLYISTRTYPPRRSLFAPAISALIVLIVQVLIALVTSLGMLPIVPILFVFPQRLQRVCLCLLGQCCVFTEDSSVCTANLQRTVHKRCAAPASASLAGALAIWQTFKAPGVLKSASRISSPLASTLRI